MMPGRKDGHGTAQRAARSGTLHSGFRLCIKSHGNSLGGVEEGAGSAEHDGRSVVVSR